MEQTLLTLGIWAHIPLPSAQRLQDRGQLHSCSIYHMLAYRLSLPLHKQTSVCNTDINGVIFLFNSDKDLTYPPSPHTCNLLTCCLWGISINLQEGCQPDTRLCGDNISLPFNGHRENKHICSRPIPDIISLLCFFLSRIMSESTTKPMACPISLTNNPAWSQRLQNTELDWLRLKMSGIGQNRTWIDCAAFFLFFCFLLTATWQNWTVSG